MGSVKAFNLPDPGEGLVEAEIVSWKVKAGDTVKVNDIIVEIETAKSLVELPVPWAGTVAQLLVAEGDMVEVGTPIIAVDTGVDDGTPSPPAPSAAPAAAVGTEGDDGEEVEAGKIGGAAPGGRVAVLVGYGPKTTEAKRRPRKGAPASAAAPTAPPPSPPAAVVPEPAAAAPAPTGASSGKALAKPPVRKFAKDRGVDLAAVPPSEGGIVSRADVEAYLAGGPGAGADRDAGAGRPAYVASGERETRIPVKGVRKVTAAAMVESAFSAPHVTEFLTFDITRTMRLVERLREDREFRNVKVSPLLLVAKALLLAVRRNPGINAAWDEAAQEIVVKNYVNLGIAAATPRGLVVPNIKDADRLSLVQLAEALGELVATARAGRTQPAEMAGGTISITNVGVFGVDTGTPILPPGESAILAFGAVRQQPWVVKGRVKVRWVTQLAVSFDHRLIDGDLGSRFLADVAAVLERPDRALVWG